MSKVEAISDDRPVIDAYSMNQILRRNEEIQDDDKVKLVDLWTTAKRIETELKYIKRLIRMTAVSTYDI